MADLIGGGLDNSLIKSKNLPPAPPMINLLCEFEINEF